MKRKLLLSILAAIPAVLMPSMASSQVAPDRPARPVNEPQYKWQAYAGIGYTSLNQVNQSRYGLIGPNIAVTRNFGRFFGITADGAWYSTATSSGNPGNPSVVTLLAGPELHAPLFEKWNFFAHALLGAEHTGGEHMRPDYSFAGGGGAGIEYQLGQHLGLRLSGDAIAASFTVRDAPAGASPHMTRNSRASLGVTYRF